MGFNFPNSPTIGQLYPQPPIAGAPVYQWDGHKWTVATGVAGTAYIGDSPPSNPPPGSLWWNSANGQLYAYYNDGTSTQWVYASQASVTPVTRSYLAGLTLSTPGSSATFSVAAGVAADSSNADMMTLLASLSKTTAAWAAGNAGALDTGAIAASTWYHAHVIKNPASQIVDALLSLSATAPALPSGYTEFRRIGGMKTNASSQWTPFTQFGDDFIWITTVADYAYQAPGALPQTLTVSVPIGVVVLWRGTLGIGTTTNEAEGRMTELARASGAMGFSNPTNEIALVQSTSGVSRIGGVLNAYTNTLAQISMNLNNVSGVNFFATTIGWTDRRGRDN
jgi:hypothetical protein